MLLVHHFLAGWASRGYGCQSSSWSAEQKTEKMIFPSPRSCLRFWSREKGLAVPSRVRSLILSPRLTQTESGGWLFVGSSSASCFPRRCPSIYLIPPTTIGSIAGLSDHVIACRWRVHGRGSVEKNVSVYREITALIDLVYQVFVGCIQAFSTATYVARGWNYVCIG